MTGPLIESHGVCIYRWMEGGLTLNKTLWGKLIEGHVEGNK